MYLGIDFFGFILFGVCCFLNLQKYIFVCFVKLGDIFRHYFFEYFLSSTLFLFSLLDSNDMNVRPFIIVTCVSEALFIYLFIFSLSLLLFKLNNFYCSMLHFTDSSFCTLHSAVEPFIKVFVSVIVFLSSKMFFWVFFTFSIYLLRLSMFSFVSSM